MSSPDPVQIVSCPQCRKSVPWTSEQRFRPFCSERCRMLDLGAWAEGSHYIPGDTSYGDDGGPPEDLQGED